MDAKMEQLILDARRVKASDIHITEGMPVWYRVHGKLTKSQLQFSGEELRALLMGSMDERQKEIFASGRDVDFGLEISDGSRQRVNIFRQQHQVAAAIRLLNTEIPTLEQLRMPTRLYQMAQQPRGLILVTGPTGSGKSTTLAAMIEHVNQNSDRHIITIEDPIEYKYQCKKSLIHQREVGEDVGSFADALRSALREDPDVILVGEMRDYETISAALLAAETGHLVLSTLHTTGAAPTVERIIDACPTGSQNQIRIQLAAALKGIVSQCLIPCGRSERSSPDSRNRTSGGYRCDPEPDPGGKDAPDFCNDAGGWKRRYAYPEYGSVPTDATGLYHERTCQRIYEQSGRT